MRASWLLPCLLALTGCPEKKTAEAPAIPTPPAKKAAVTATPDANHVVEMAVTEDGFVPANISLKKDEPVTLRITRKTEATCATELLIADTEINVPLPLNEAVEVKYTPTKTGKVKYGCAMGMMISGVLLVE